MIKVLLVDDHALFRTGLSSVLDGSGDIEVIGEASSGEEAVEQARKLSPDLVLMDVHMPGIGGIEGIKLVREALPDTHIIAMSGGWDGMTADNSGLAARKIGANAFLKKPFKIEDLQSALPKSARGWLDSPFRLENARIRDLPRTLLSLPAAVSPRKLRIQLSCAVRRQSRT